MWWSISVKSHKTISFRTVPELFTVHTLSDVFTSTFTTYWNSVLIPYNLLITGGTDRYRLIHRFSNKILSGRLSTDWQQYQVLTGNRWLLHIQLHVCQYFCVRQPETLQNLFGLILHFIHLCLILSSFYNTPSTAYIRVREQQWMISCGVCDRRGHGLFEHTIMKFQWKDHESQKESLH